MWITVNPVSSHAVGDVFTIKGTTNILRDEKVFIQVFPGGMYIRDHYGQCAGCHEKEILAFSTYDFVNVTEGEHGINRWSLAVNMSGWLPVMSDVSISDIYRNKTGTRTETMFELFRKRRITI
jgi:hypothetical protein